MNAPDPVSEELIIDTDKLLTPIGGDNPTGETCNYEPEFEAVEIELAKLSSIELEEVNWESVSENCQKLLDNKSKDLQVSCFLAMSLFHTHGYQGLNEGLQLIDQLQNSFWHDLFPPIKRMRGRAAAISWLNSQLVKSLPQKPPEKADAECLEELYMTAESIAQFTTAYIDQNTPNLSELLRLLNGYRSTLQVDQAKPEVNNQDSTGTSAPNTVTQKSTPSTEKVPEEPISTAPNDLSKTQQSARKSLKVIAESLRENKLNDAQHFYLNRVAVWLPVTELPMNDSGKTQLQPPADEVIHTLHNQLESGEYEAVINAVEDILASSPFWFEGNKISAQAMEESGKKYQQARVAVISTTHSFLQRFPKLSGLSFADGSAFVSDNFKQWLASETGQQQESNSGFSSSSHAETINQDTVNQARKLANKSKLADALELLDNELKSASSGKEKFSLRILQAELCSSSERYDMATPILELLDQEQQQREMSSWEPELSTQVLQSLLNCYTKIIQKKPANSDNLQARADSVFDRLCQLQPTAAFKYKL